MPAHRVATSPYAPRGLYVLSEHDGPLWQRSGWNDPGAYAEEDRSRVRWFEFEATGFAALNGPAVMGHDLDARLFLPRLSIHASWERLHEVRLNGTLDHLDILGGHLAFNVTGPYTSWLEPHLLIGASGMHGVAWTPAFDAGLDARIYPINPLVLRPSAMVSVFAHGPPLLDARFEIGVSLGRFDVVAGPRVLYQGQAQGFWGPAASLVARF